MFCFNFKSKADDNRADTNEANEADEASVVVKANAGDKVNGADETNAAHKANLADHPNELDELDVATKANATYKAVVADKNVSIKVDAANEAD